MPNQKIEYYWYARGKMSVNDVSTIWGHISQVIEHWLGNGYT